MSSTPSVIVIGSINTDMLVTSERLPSAGETVLGSRFKMSGGGKGANQAVAAARLGAKVTMVGCVGDDLFGTQAKTNLEAESVDCSNVLSVSNEASGIALISVDGHGENQIVVAPGANNEVSETQIAKALESAASDTIVMLQLEIPQAAVEYALNQASAKGTRIILDPAPARPLSADSLSKVYLLTPNQTEAEMLTNISINDFDAAQRAAKALLNLGVQNVALTMGGDGVLLANNGNHLVIPAIKVSPQDTTAAGDCFNGALASALSNENSLEQATRYACKAAAIAVTRVGAQDSMPSLEEIRQ